MDKVPGMDQFKAGLTGLYSGMKSSKDNGEWGWLIGYTVFVLLIVVAGLGYFAGGIDQLVSTVKKYIPTVQAPFSPKTLTYERLSHSEDANGLYYDLFAITITNPAGNTNPDFLITTTGINPDTTECERGSETGRIEAGLGVATSTNRFLMDCTSKERILDTGKVFGILETKHAEKH
jgi:hypothetical protein